MERRLTAIFAADMVGFSRLVEADEIGTLSRQKLHRAELIDPRISQHGGRIIKLTGDGIIAEFPSVVEAVQCAVSVQREMEVREADVPEERKIRYRVAINLGDIIFDDGDIYGDGVNIAARLEALAEPGGIVVSGTAYDHLKSNVEVGYEDLGEQQVKNIATPVRVYRVVPEGGPVMLKQGPRRRLVLVVPAVVAMLIVAGIAVWEFAIRTGRVDVVHLDREAVLAIPEGPTVAVLPFENQGGAPEQDYFAKGISLEVISELGLYRNLRVLGQSATFALTNDARDPRRVGTSIGADYVLDGYVRRADERVRVTAQLFNAKTGAQVWNETFDQPLTPANLFEVQDKIVKRTTVAIGDHWTGAITLSLKEQSDRKPPEDLSVYECNLFAIGDWYRPEHLKHMFDCAIEATKKEPSFAPSWATLSFVYRMDYNQQFGVTGVDWSDRQRLSLEAAETASRLYPDHPYISFMLATAYMLNRDRERFWAESENFLSLGWRSNSLTGWLGWFLAVSGRWEFGKEIIDKAISLSPGNYPKQWHWLYAYIHMKNGEYEKALKEFHTAAIPGFWYTETSYAQIYVRLGRMDDAKSAIARLLENYPDFTIARFVDFWRGHLLEDEIMDRWIDDLRAAGLPLGGNGERSAAGN